MKKHRKRRKPRYKHPAHYRKNGEVVERGAKPSGLVQAVEPKKLTKRQQEVADAHSEGYREGRNDTEQHLDKETRFAEQKTKQIRTEAQTKLAAAGAQFIDGLAHALDNI